MAAPTARGLHRLDTVDLYRLVLDFNRLSDTATASDEQVLAAARQHSDGVRVELEAIAAALGVDPSVSGTTTVAKNLWPDPRATDVARMVAKAGTTTLTSTGTGSAYRLTTSAAGAGGTSDMHSPLTPVPAGTGSVWVTMRTRASAAAVLRVTIWWLQGTASLGTTRADVATATAWTPARQRFTVPTGADNFRIYVGMPDTATQAVGDTWDVADLGILTGDVAFFHGSTPDVNTASRDEVHTWDGAADGSTSTVSITDSTVTIPGWEAGRTIIEAITDTDRLIGATPSYSTTTLRAQNLWIDPAMKTVGNMLPKSGTLEAVTYSTGPSYKVTADGTGQTSMRTTSRPPVPAGTSRVWVTWRAFADASRDAAVALTSLQGTTALSSQNHTVRVTGGWVTYRELFDLPAGTDNFRIEITAGVGTVPAGAHVTVDDLAVLTADVDFFHGGMPDVDGTEVDGVETDIDYSWDGTVDASSSTMVRTTTTLDPGSWVPGKTVASRLSEMEAKVAAVGTGGGGAAGQPGVVTPPAGWALRTLEVPTVYDMGAGYTSSLTDETLRAAYVPTAGATLWVSPAGGGNGASRSTPTTLASALQAKASRIMLTSGEYRAATATASGLTTHDYALIAADPGVIVTGYMAAPVWTARGDGAFTAPVAATGVVDPRPQHDTDPARGIHATYQKVASAAAVTSPGQWFADATTTTVWPLGGTDLTAAPDTLRLSGKVRTGIYASAGTVYAEGITFEGGWDTPHMLGGLFVGVDCHFRYSAISNGLNIRNANSICLRCTADGNWYDGFNYHEAAGGTCDFIEIHCEGHRNGQASKAGNCNGSTAHESTHGLRVGGHYGDTFGPILADVNDARTWTIGAATERTTSAMSTLPHVQADGTATTGEVATMWVQAHTATGLGTAWKGSGGAIVRLRAENATTTTLMDTTTGTVTREWDIA